MIRFSRRMFLGGAGAAVALPALESIAPRRAFAQTAAPKRFLAYFLPNGINMAEWTPDTVGADFDLKAITEPIAPFKDQILMIGGLSNTSADEPQAGDHARGTGCFLTCTPIGKSEAEIENGISVDQLAAQSLPLETRFRSLELGLEGGGNAGACDNGYGCAYVRSISWAGPKTPLSKMVDVRSVFDRLFGGSDPGSTEAERARRRQYRKSILDYVRGDANELRGKMGSVDQQKMDEYLTGVRELEMAIERSTAAGTCGDVVLPEGAIDLTEQARIMGELIVTAFRCDLTRIASFMMANGASNRSYDFLDARGAHHEISHHQMRPDRLEKLTRIGRWEMEQFAYIVQRMASIPEGDGTLLDSACLFLSSEVADGDAHEHHNLPVMIAGRCGGAFSPGRHVHYDDDEPIANLYISILRALDVTVDAFGMDGTGPLPGLST